VLAKGETCMCGRYVLKLLTQIDQAMGVERGRWEITDNFRVLPTTQVPVLRMTEGLHEAAMMRWGMVPFSAHGELPKVPWINARSETLAETFPWKGPWARQQRCILPAAGFYEPHLNEDGKKQPYYIHLVDREVFGMAGLWERSFKSDGTEALSCTIVMLPANSLMAEVHNEKKRMPAILSREDHDAWLSGSPTDAQAALQPYPDDLMVAYPVSSRVNSLKATNDANLIAPIPPRQEG
jgi:putative SOS response-associated peptidase YedK